MEAVNRIREWLCLNNYDGIILSRRDNFAWVSGGADSAVLLCCETGVAYYVIKKEGAALIADSSDLPRMAAEQNPLQADPVLVPWYAEPMDEFLKHYIGDGAYASDTGIAGTLNVQEQLIDMRLCLTPDELEQYEIIGQECAKIVEGVCREARPGQSEIEIATLVKSRCIAKGISPDCVLVGADRRIMDYRHPVPSNKKIEKSLMVVLGGQKYGLNISMTRMVYYGTIPREIRERYQKTSHIFACMQLVMKEGLRYGEYFEKIRCLYQEAGCEEEWKKHHQGGPTGYGCREFVVTPDNQKVIHVGQAYAWNPTIQGTKCEETTYLEPDGIKILTRTADWPCLKIGTPQGMFEVADILVQPDCI